MDPWLIANFREKKAFFTRMWIFVGKQLSLESYIISFTSHFTTSEYLVVRSFPRSVKYYSVNQNFFRAEKKQRDEHFRGKRKKIEFWKHVRTNFYIFFSCWRNVPLSKYSRFSRPSFFSTTLFNFHFQLVSTFSYLLNINQFRDPCEEKNKTHRERSAKKRTSWIVIANGEFKSNLKVF